MNIANSRAIMLLLPALRAGLSGCASQQPAADKPAHLYAMPYSVVATGDSRADTTAATTFSWPAAPAAVNNERGTTGAPVNALLEEAIATTLQQKGYRYSAAAGQGDLIVSYDYTLNDAAADKQLAQKYGMQSDLNYTSPDPEQFEKGTLVIDVIERHSGLTAWRSSLQGFAYLQISAAERRQRIHSMVQRMLSGLPARN